MIKSRLMSFFGVRSNSLSMDLAFLALRCLYGYAFILHGWGKIQTPFAWMPSGSPVPGGLQALAALAEFGGGIALILGSLTRLAALGLLCTMTVAVAMHAVVFGDPFMHPAGGRSYELASVYLGVSLVFVVAGPGRLSLDRLIFGRR